MIMAASSAAAAGAMDRSDGDYKSFYASANHRRIESWIVEHYCHLFWNEFQSLGRLKTLWKVIFALHVGASPNTARPPPDDDGQEEDPSDCCKRLLIRLMFYLTDSTDILTGDEKRKDLCRLEHAMRAFEGLVRLECVRHQLDDSDLKKMRILLKEQSVLVCWKMGDYDLAKAVCDRQYQYYEDCDVQKSLDKLHRALLQQNTDVWSSLSSYSDLIDFSKEVLKKVFDAMEPPFLVVIDRRCSQFIREDEADVDQQPSASIENLSLSQLTDEEQEDRRTNTGGVGIGVPADPDPVQLPSQKKRPASSAAERAEREPIIEVQSADSDSEEESEGEGPMKKIRESSLDSGKSSERKKEEASTSNAVDNELDFNLYFDSEEELQSSHGKKQRRRVWTAEEERDVYLGVKKFGAGNWTKVARFVGTGRSNVDVKDKWRNLGKQGKIQEFRDLYGPI